jgi:hypothetical protein
MHHLHFNHYALLVSALLQWFLGAIWYSPVLFAKPWMAIVGIQPGNAKKNSMIAGMIMSFVGSLVLSFVLAHLILWSGATTAGWGALIGFIVWAGFMAAPLSASYNLRRPPIQALRHQPRLLVGRPCRQRHSARTLALRPVTTRLKSSVAITIDL